VVTSLSALLPFAEFLTFSVKNQIVQVRALYAVFEPHAQHLLFQFCIDCTTCFGSLQAAI
jgi:hypothetical protein